MTAAPVYDIDQFVADPHVQARQIVVDVPDDEIGTVTMHNVIPRLSATPGALRRPAPKLGEHTAEILARVGVDGADLAELAVRKDCLMSEPRPDLPAWRSLLFVPVTREKFVASAHTRGADAIILDLEDSVPETEKDRARARSCRRPPRRSARAAPTCSCASTAPGIRPSATSRRSSGPASRP